MGLFREPVVELFNTNFLFVLFFFSGVGVGGVGGIVRCNIVAMQEYTRHFLNIYIVIISGST
jgi:hypothetical protein